MDDRDFEAMRTILRSGVEMTADGMTDDEMGEERTEEMVVLRSLALPAAVAARLSYLFSSGGGVVPCTTPPPKKLTSIGAPRR